MKESERASEGGRERPSPSSSSGLAERERGRPRPRRPIMQNGPRLLKATLPFADDGERARMAKTSMHSLLMASSAVYPCDEINLT